MTGFASLSGSAQFQAVQRSGRRSSLPGISASYLPQESAVRLGLAVRASGAVKRNRIKRRLRAALRESLAVSSATGNLLIRADERVNRMSFQELVEFLDSSVRKGQTA